jgi:hypothetical protein
MRKLDKLSMRPTEDREAAAAEAAADQGIAAVFAVPGPIDKEYFTAFRDLLPAAGQQRWLHVLSLVVIPVRV